MNIAILNCDQIKPEFEQAYGQYPKMFKSLLSNIDKEMIFSEFDVMHGEYPQDINDSDLFIITGSRADAYADIPWINHLKVFINKLNDQKKKAFWSMFWAPNYSPSIRRHCKKGRIWMACRCR